MNYRFYNASVRCAVADWLVLISCERKVLLAGWCWFGVREKYCWLVAAEQSEWYKYQNEIYGAVQ